MRRHPSLTETLPMAACMALLLAILPAPAAAQGKVDCRDQRNTHDHNVCVERDYRSADARLNSIHEQVAASLKDHGGDAQFTRTSHLAALKAAPRAWIAFRDADCKELMPMEWTGGSGTTAAVLGCLSTKTNERANDLAERYGIK